jgi:hypothetical protein
LRNFAVCASVTPLIDVLPQKQTAGGRAMRKLPLGVQALLLGLFMFHPPSAFAGGVQAMFNVNDPAGAPFPSDRFTVGDASQNTALRVNLPLPNPSTNPDDFADIEAINALDGFNVQPRISIPFSGAIDPHSVNSKGVFLVNLGSTLPGGPLAGTTVGINQIVWDPDTDTLHAESNDLLEQHTVYALVVTNGVRDAGGNPVQPSDDFKHFRHDLNFGQTKDARLKAYRKELLAALAAIGSRGGIVALSVFTTQSVTSTLERVRDQIESATPQPATFLLGPQQSRTVFALSQLTGITFSAQTGTAPTFTSLGVPLAALNAIPGAISTIAFGKFSSPNYEDADQVILQVASRTGVPMAQGANDVYLNLFLPATPKPPGGWPVAIFGHGFGDDKNDSPLLVASLMAANGIATVAINAVGHGFGPLGTLTVSQTVGAPVTFSAGGRGFDQNGDGVIGSTEGLSAFPPTNIVGDRDGLRQTAIDLMQLVREIRVGMDVDGDGTPDLDPSRIYYLGQSLGGIYGTIFLAVEPNVLFGVPNVPGGSLLQIARLSPDFRVLVALALAIRTPSLLNEPFPNFNEALPLRDQPPLINMVPGADAIQQYFDHSDWVGQAGDPVAYAPYLRKAPLSGMPGKSVIIQFAKGDQTVPNPTSSALIRAGALTDRTTYYRNDLAFAADPSVPKNPHIFLVLLVPDPLIRSIAFAAQQQIATFFDSGGTVTIDPDSLTGPLFPDLFEGLFEVPIAGPLPEELNFIP